MNARVPTLPTPTTLRAASTNSKRSSSAAAVRLQRPAVRRELLLDQGLGVLGERRDRSCATSRRGTMNGGWLTIR